VDVAGLVRGHDVAQDFVGAGLGRRVDLAGDDLLAEVHSFCENERLGMAAGNGRNFVGCVIVHDFFVRLTHKKDNVSAWF